MAEVLESGADLLDGTELKGIGETVRGNAESISGVARRVDALDSKVTGLTCLLDSLQTALGQGIDGLNAQINDVHADVKTPRIVKRFFLMPPVTRSLAEKW